jgi:hypothetical protein
MRDDLDKLIDGALSTYTNAEPIAGLEERVLERVRMARRTRARRWWCAIAAAVSGAVLIGILARKPQPAPVARIEPPPVQLSIAPPPPRVVVEVRRPARAPRRPTTPRALPKRELFPTPMPLTKEERMLVALAEAHPQELMARPVGEIEIKPIQIAPLQVDGGQ